MSKVRQRLTELLEPAVEALGYELVDLETNFSGRSGVLRLYIDREGGVGLDDCEAVSHQVSGILDVEDPIKREYDLEVSSPGLDRKLMKPAHFGRFAGRKVKGRLKRLVDGRRQFTGELLRYEDRHDGGMVTVSVDGAEFTVPLEELEVLRLVPEI